MFTEKELTGHYLRTAMNSSEVRELLMGIKLVDNRRVSDGSVEMWRRILSDLELDECKLAPPKNLKEMTDFYRDLAAKIQWGPHEDPDKVARKLGMNPPTPLWDDEA